MPTRALTAVMILLALVGSLAAGTAYAEDDAPRAKDDAEIERYLADYADANSVPGLAVAVVDDTGVREHLRGTDGDGREITTQTPFLIGSVAKSMTGTLIMELEADGELTLDDPVSAHLDHLPEGDPTIRQLLTHTAGFTAADGIAVADRYDNEPGAIRRAVQDLEQSGTVGDYAYTSADFLVLGAVVEEVTGRPFAEVLDERLLGPLGMDASGATAEEAADLPPGHRLWWGRAVGFDPDHDESGAPYASVTATLSDLTTYARAQLGAIPGIPKSIRERMQQPHVESSQDHYGLGWSITGADGSKVVHHTGATPGFFTHVLLVPDEDVAVVLLANVYAESRAPSLAAAAQDIWKIAQGEEPRVAGGDPMLSALAWVLVGLVLVAMVLVVVSRRRPLSRAARWVAAVVAILVALALWMLPSFFGQDPRALRIWVPDAGWSLIAALVVWVLAAAAFLVPPRRDGTRG